MSWVEALGFATGALSVWLAVRENVWNWWIGIANNLFYIVIFAQSRLFADAGLQVFFIVISVWGIVQWLRGGAQGGTRAVGRLPRGEAGLLAAALVAGTAALAAYLARVNDAAPVLDALTTAGSLIAQYLLARKYLENWYVWIGVDVVSIGLYAWKALPLTALLYAIFLGMCVVGLRSWSRSAAAPAP